MNRNFHKHFTARSLATIAGLTLVSLLAQQPVAAAGSIEPQTPPAHSPGQALESKTADHGKDDRLRVELARADRLVGAETGGSFVDRSGRVVVTVTTGRAADAVRAQGARVEHVDDTEKRLERIMDTLNRWSRSHDAGSIQAWRLDVPANSVVVTATQGADDKGADALLRLARQFGDSVRIEHQPASVAAAPAESLYGGLEFRYASGSSYSTCSTGFTGLDSANRHIVLTAGHCLTSRQTPYRNGYTIGAVKSFQFGPADWGVFYNSYPTFWQPYAAVSTYNGSTMAVRGTWNAPPVGATSCKSGRTTGWTCGTIRSTNVTVRYETGQTLYNMVQHNACTEGGDSGGSVMSSGGYALGLTSGSQYFWLNGRKVCGQKVGRPNVSYYQPIGPVLSASATRIWVTG